MRGEHQVGLVPRDEVEHRAEHRRVAEPGAQVVGGKAGQRQQARGAVVVGQDPAERGQRQCLGIDRRGWSVAENCQPRRRRIEPSRMAKRILVVEDNDLNRKLFCDLLRANGFAVEPLADGQAVMERTRQFVPNLVIMDIQLPTVSGLELIEAIKADRELRSIPVLAVTAYAGKGDEERIRQAGAEGYLAKPVSIGPFMVAVRQLV